MMTYKDQILIKTCDNLNNFLPEGSSRNTQTKIGRQTLNDSANVAHNQFHQTHRKRHSHPKLQIPLPQLKTQLR